MTAFCLSRRWILFLFSFGGVSLAAGLVYGWPALRQELLDENHDFSEAALGAIFTAGAWSTQGGRFFFGMLRDRYGTRSIACASLGCAAAGSLGIALSQTAASLGVSLFFTGLGSGLQLVVQPVASLFPKHAGSILSSLSGAFQVSGLVFLGLTSAGNRRGAFLGFMGCLLGLAVLAALLLPQGQSFVLPEEVDANNDPVAPTEEEGASSSSVHSLSSSSLQSEPTPSSPVTNDDDEEEETDPSLSPPTALQQLVSYEYAGLTGWFSLSLVPLQYYVGSIGYQLEEKGDESGFYTDLFAICYAGAALVAPAAGSLADRWGVGVAQAVATLLIASSLFVLAANGISLDAHVVGLVAYSVGRMLCFSAFFTNVGTRFGYRNYGTLAGLGLWVSAIVSLLQYPLIALTADGHGVAVNLVCASLLMATLPYCLWLYRQEKRFDQAQLGFRNVDNNKRNYEEEER